MNYVEKEVTTNLFTLTSRASLFIPFHHGDCKIRYKVRVKNIIIANNLTFL